MKHFFIISVLFLVCACKQETRIPVDYSSLPKNELQQVVLDLSNVFNMNQIDTLSQMIIDFEKRTSNEIAILTVDSIAPYEDLHVYSSAIGNYWGVGKANKDNGLVIVLLKNQRQIWLSTGNGTTNVLTDSVCQKIIDSVMIPNFKEGQYYLGMKKGLVAIMEQWH
ncbi:MAG: TPM domain-containing protein [Algicola sp.]|nr:TPM domain-containing protein [Algicola sp.]